MPSTNSPRASASLRPSRPGSTVPRSSSRFASARQDFASARLANWRLILRPSFADHTHACHFGSQLQLPPSRVHRFAWRLMIPVAIRGPSAQG
jgi:hypothetical protein